MSVHQFDTEIAKEYGIEAAIILQNLTFWIEKNKANGVHFHDGAYWTYNSIKAFNELFPYMSESTIRRTLKSLEEKGLIKTGNYNKVGYDRTMWYSITENGFYILNKSILSKRQMELVKTSNPFSQNVNPIPDSKPTKKPDEKHNIENKIKKGVYIEIGEHYTKEYEEVKKQKPVIVYPAVNKRIKSLLESGITDEQIKQSITVAKKDRWIVDTGKFSLLTILSDNVLSRLLSDIPKPSSRPSSSRSCPSCGSELVGLFCKTCMIQYNEKMEAVF